MSLENWQDELQLENQIDELAEEHMVTPEYIADHLDRYLTDEQEDDIIESGLESWKEKRWKLMMKKINDWWQMLSDNEKKDIYFFNRGK